MESVAGSDEPGEAARPRAVTAIGRIWLVAGILFLAVAVVDLILWFALRPAMPTILGYAAEREPGFRLLGPYFEHYATIKFLEAVFASAVVVSAYHFLKLRPWARGALEAASWLYLAYLLAFVGFSYWARRHLSVEPSAMAARAHARERLLGGLGVGVLLVAGLVWMIVVLRGRRLRDAFQPGTGADTVR